MSGPIQGRHDIVKGGFGGVVHNGLQVVEMGLHGHREGGLKVGRVNLFKGWQGKGTGRPIGQ
eukprot:scaffold4603_cov175-Amphora_coffeaeformis.AAC.4